MNEIWKTIPGYADYKVSNLGNVKSFKNSRVLELTKIKMPSGYFVVNLIGAKRKRFYIHQLVCIAFLGHNPNGHKIVCNHINHIRGDNRVENLEIVTQRQNVGHRKKISTSKFVGVSWYHRSKKWKAQIYKKGTVIGLGYFSKEVDAHIAYQNSVKTL